MNPQALGEIEDAGWKLPGVKRRRAWLGDRRERSHNRQQYRRQPMRRPPAASQVRSQGSQVSGNTQGSKSTATGLAHGNPREDECLDGFTAEVCAQWKWARSPLALGK
jgi:hypothetical protein